MKKKIVNFLKKRFCFHNWELVKDLTRSFMPVNDHLFHRCNKCGAYKESERDYGYGIQMDYTYIFYDNNKRYLEIVMEELIK